MTLRLLSGTLSGLRVPRSAPSACATPMCAGMATRGTLCDVCKKERQTTYRDSPERARLNKFYGSPLWRRLSARIRKERPLCEWCTQQGLTVLTDVVDHINPVRTHWERRFDKTNMQCLCHSCHAKKTASDRRR